MSVSISIEHCFNEAEETGKLLLGSRNLRDFPDVSEDCELIDVIEAGKKKKSWRDVASFVLEFLEIYIKVKSFVSYFLYFQDLSRNRLTEFPAEISDFVMLERLDLYHNALRSLPDLSVLRALQYLNLRWGVRQRLSKWELISQNPYSFCYCCARKVSSKLNGV